MLRISSKERKQLYNLNARVKKLQKTNQRLYGMQPEFQTVKPKDFLTRMEVNHYKNEMRNYLKNNKFKQGNLKQNSPYFYAISQQNIKRIHEASKSMNRYTYKLNQMAKNTNLQIGGKQQDMTTFQQAMQFNKMVKKKGQGSRRSEYYPYSFYSNLEKIGSDEELERHIYGLQTFNSYMGRTERFRQARENYNMALYNAFGNLAEPIAEIIAELNPMQFNLLYDSEHFIDFDFVYSEEYKEILLKQIANGLYAFLFQTDLIMKPKFRNKIDALKEIYKLDSAVILANYTPHTRTWTESDGTKYQKTFRSNELDRFINEGANDKDRKDATILKVGRNGIRR